MQRPTGFALGNEHAVGYGYDVSGRLATLSAQGLPNLPGKTHAFEYIYEPGSSLLDKVTGPVHEVDNTYETHRNVLSEKKNTRTVGTPGELSVIGYTVNELGQREQRNLSGEIRAEFYSGQSNDPYATNWTYDALGQVTSEDKPATASDRGYTYDLIGNRLTSTADSVTTSYLANNLNQYSSIENQQSSIINPVHDADGNMTTGLLNGSGNGQFEYDGANQLILTQATATSDPTKYAYDAFGRRIAKVTYPNGSAIASAATVFLYDGWNLIAEYKLDAGTWALDRTYTWGLDLSGSTQGAGGVGGLLSVTKHEAQSTTHFYPIYDGNGNIEAYIDSNGSPAAIYQYDAFGNVLSGEGKGVAIEQAKFPHRFSTKFQDAETGLLYYGYRYNHTILGRWINRDPLGEAGGVALYKAYANSSINRVDALGLTTTAANTEFYTDTIMYSDNSKRWHAPSGGRIISNPGLSPRPVFPDFPEIPDINKGAANVEDIAGPVTNVAGAVLGVVAEGDMWMRIISRSREQIQQNIDVKDKCDRGWASLKQSAPKWFKEGCPACCLYFDIVDSNSPLGLNDGRTFYPERSIYRHFYGFEPGHCFIQGDVEAIQLTAIKLFMAKKGIILPGLQKSLQFGQRIVFNGIQYGVQK